MASEEKKVIELGTKGKVYIRNGPNDWDLWLCLRGTIKSLDFFTDQPVRFFPGGASQGFFAGQVTLLQNNDKFWMSRLYLEGVVMVDMGGMIQLVFKFRGTYNTSDRKGTFWFERCG